MKSIYQDQKILGSVLLVGAIAFLTANLAIAGGFSDGGANAIVCVDSQQNISKVELLDLFEARNLRNQTPLPDERHYSVIADELSHNISRGFLPNPISLGVLTRQLDAKKHILLPGVRLKPISDSDHFIQPPSPNCEIKQVAIYRVQTDKLYVVGDFWEKMDSVNKAALLVHEALYYETRFYGETNSDRTRIAIGHAVGGANFTPANDDVPDSAIRCTSLNKDPFTDMPFFEFWVFKIDDEHTRIQFEIFNANLIIGKTFADLNSSISFDPKEKQDITVFPVLDSLIDGGKRAIINSKFENDKSTIKIGTFTPGVVPTYYLVHCK